jgi:hypothetical protein
LRHPFTFFSIAISKDINNIKSMEMNCMNLNDKKDSRRVILDRREKVDTGIRSEWDNNIFFKLSFDTLK